ILRRLARIVRDLEPACYVTEDRTHPRLRVQDRRGIAEEVTLVGTVVDRIVAVGRILNAEITGEAETSDKIFRCSDPATVFEARRHGAETAAIDTDAAALLQ